MTFGQIYYIWNVKRIASTLLLFLFLFNIIGYYAVFLLLSSENKAEIVKMTQDENLLETIRIHRSEVKNIVFKDEGKELLYKGEMYDVKTSSIDGDFIVFRCINDKSEKQLLAGLDSHVKYNTDSNSSSEKKQNDSSSKNPVKDLFCHQNNIAETSSVAVVFPSAICHFTSYIPSTLPLPPPEVFIS